MHEFNYILRIKKIFSIKTIELFAIGMEKCVYHVGETEVKNVQWTFAGLWILAES
jgi:hypothetical protein